MNTDNIRPQDAAVLEAINAEYDRNGAIKNVDAVAELANLDRDATERSLKALHSLGLINGIDVTTFSGYDLAQIEPTGRGRAMSG